MSGMHRFKSIYLDDSCGGAPTGVFVQRRNDCEGQVASSGTTCEAHYDDDDNLIGYVEDSCHDGRGAGFDALFGDESYMAYDYFYGDDCTDYENSAAYRASGECETMFDGYSPVRSATILVTMDPKHGSH
ncbi:TKL/DRK protein kinase [Phytophthora palmivora]|uniref:TKL/DRK protein kinase n=1 Tax=Phytophthora palmivora TaxID=4796 RepID=A0A2P4YAS6_9STRA|nr:TKL/DRK protein kinase [Phytophthora palmivora]